MALISIISDDLTGITDCASAFYEMGYNCSFSIENSECSESDIYFYNSHTRNIKKIDILAEEFKKFKKRISANSIIIKKIDSTLRGNIEKEIECFFREFGFAKIAFLPENPLNKRIYTKNTYFVDGIPLKESFYSKDPKSPADMEIFSKLNKKYGNKVWSPEISSQNELIHAVKNALDNSFGIVGSSSIAFGFPKKENKKEFSFENDFSTLLISGSLNEKNRKQIENAKKYFKKIEITELENIFNNNYSMIDISSSINESEYIKNAKIIGKYICDKNINVIICGGNTSELILDGFNESFRVIQNIAPGIPLLKYNKRKFILKPGGFGSKEFYNICIESIK